MDETMEETRPNIPDIISSARVAEIAKIYSFMYS
jgi:hypothetical protein